MKNKDRFKTFVISLVIFAILVYVLVQPYFEAQTFNKLTGGNATYWDALFAELRVTGK